MPTATRDGTTLRYETDGDPSAAIADLRDRL